MIKVERITLRNFLSVGNVKQTIDFTSNGLTLILGENLDVGGNNSRNGTGKAQPLFAKVKVPNGWINMGDVTVGTVVSTPDGKTAKVNGVFPQGKLKTYEITFQDGRKVQACGDHLWSVSSYRFGEYEGKNRKKSTKVISTKEIIELLKDQTWANGKPVSGKYLYVPLIEHEDMNDIELPIEPWFMGAMLGDGSMTDNNFSFSNGDTELINKCNAYLMEYSVGLNKIGESADHSFKNIDKQKHGRMVIKNKFDDLGLVGCYSYNKFIPEIYKNASKKQKLELIQGLMDTDGSVSKDSSLTFSTSSKQLCDDLVEIVRSLGGQAKVENRQTFYTYKNEKKAGRPSYRITFKYKEQSEFISLTRKKDLLNKNGSYQYANAGLRIMSVTESTDEECQCISLDSEDKLYITNDYTVTHNTTILQGLSFGLYGNAVSNIKKDNLVNNINNKNMEVTVEFTAHGISYRIERGRKPQYLRFYVNDVKTDEDADESQGDSRNTQLDIDKILGMSHDLFKHIVALNTYTEPFLKMRAADQRNVIEELLGITQLTSRSDLLREMIKNTKDSIKQEEYSLQAIRDANQVIENTIADTIRRSDDWQAGKQKTLDVTELSIAELSKVDIEQEIVKHQLLADYNVISKEITTLNRELDKVTKETNKKAIAYGKLEEQLKSAEDHKCMSCGQDIHDDVHSNQINELKSMMNSLESELAAHIEETKTIGDALAQLTNALHEIGDKPVTIYNDLSEAYAHQSTIERFIIDLEREKASENPYSHQIEELKQKGIRKVDNSVMDELVTHLKHQEFLLKLLSNKDSFIRKKIIEQNINHLNHRLNYYLNKLGLPHEVAFQSDLTVDITLLGRDFDFEQLSRGEMNRVIISTSWAFRDIWESLNQSINLMFVDELIDNGIDAQGAEAALDLLKNMVREREKNIFLISHKEELVGRVNSILRVKKENSFATFEYNIED